MTTVSLSSRQLEQVQQILRVLDNIPLPPAANRRLRPRVNIHLNLEATIFTSMTLPRVQIVTRNLSTSGLGFVSRREFRVGELIAIHLNVEKNPIRLILGAAAFCRYLRGGLYDVGVEFLEASKPGRTRIPSAWMQRAHLLQDEPRSRAEEPPDPTCQSVAWHAQAMVRQS